MGLGGYCMSTFPACFSSFVDLHLPVASQAELDHFHYLRKQTQARVLRSCAGEMEREVHSILGPLGVKETVSRLIAEDLRAVDDHTQGERVERNEGVMAAQAQLQRVVPEEKKRGILSGTKREAEEVEEDGGPKGNEDMGLTAFLIKFGEGLGRLSFSGLGFKCSYLRFRGGP